MRRRNLLQLLAGTLALPGLAKAAALPAPAPEASAPIKHKEWDITRGQQQVSYSSAQIEGEEIIFEQPERNRYSNRVLTAQLLWAPIVPGTLRLHVNGHNIASDAGDLPRSFKIDYETGEMTYYSFGGIEFVGCEPGRICLQADYKYAMG